MLVFIAGALSSGEKVGRTPSKVVADYLANCHRMITIARDVMRRGHAPFIPALDLLVGIVSGDVIEKEYRLCSISFLSVCDAVLVISHSVGVDRELGIAKGLKIPIYERIEDLPEGFSDD